MGRLRTAVRAATRIATRTAKRSAAGAALPAEDDRIVVSYEPDLDGDADPGEVVWGWVPFEDDPTRGKDRPIAVIGRWGNDLCGVPLSSKERPGDPDRVPVGTGGWDRERRPSWACLDRVLRLRASEVRREGAALDRRAFERVVDAYHARRS